MTHAAASATNTNTNPNAFRRHRFTVVVPKSHATGVIAQRAQLPEAFAADIGRCAPLSREESIAAAVELRDAREGCWRAILSDPRRAVSVLPTWTAGPNVEGRAAYDATSLDLRRHPDDRRVRRAHEHASKVLAAALVKVDQCPDVLPRDRDDLGLARARTEVARLARRDPGLRPWRASIEQAFARRTTALAFLETRNLRLVAAIARRYLSHHGADSLTLSDLIAYGAFGLRLACLRFDPDKGFAFSTYATNWIRHSIGRSIADHGRLIRISSHTCDRLHKITAAQRRLAAEGKPVNDATVAKATGIAARFVRKSAEDLMTAQVASLEAPCVPAGEGGDDGTTSLRQAYPDDAAPLDDALAARERESILLDLMATLSPRERLVVAARFGLDDGHERLLGEIGKDIGVGRERVRQVEKEALQKMRAEAVARGFGADLFGKSAGSRGHATTRPVQVVMAIG